MEVFENICYGLGFGILSVLIISSLLYLIIITHKALHKEFHLYRRAFGLFVSFPISIISLMFYKKRTAIITYSGWIQLGYNESDLIEYRLIGKLLKRKARIKDFLEYAEAVNYMKQNKSNTIFCEDYAYRKGLSITIEEYKNK